MLVKTHDFKPEISLTNARTDLARLFLKLHYLWQESGLHNVKSEKLTPGTHMVSSLPTTLPSPAKKRKKKKSLSYYFELQYHYHSAVNKCCIS